MATWTGEEIAEGMEQWLKRRRDEYPLEHGSEAAVHHAIDSLLDEAREAFVQGWMPWQTRDDD